MLGTFILGVIAGWGAPYAEPKVREAIESILLDAVPVDAAEMRLIAFALSLLLAAFLSMVLAVPHAAPLALGAAIGILGPKAVDKWKASRAPDYDS
jgi:hypothetical protein